MLRNMFGYLIPRYYTEALELDKDNTNTKWYDATKAEKDSIHSYEASKSMKRNSMTNKSDKCTPRIPENQSSSYFCSQV